MVRPSSPRQDGGHVVVGDQRRAGEPVRLAGVRAGRSGDAGGHRPDIAGVDHPDPALAGAGPEAVQPGDHRGQGQDVLHVGIRAQQRAGQARGGQAGLDLRRPAPPGNGRVRGRVAARLHDMPGAGLRGAADDIQLLGGIARADQDHGGNARHRLVDARRRAQVAHGYLRPRAGQGFRPGRVPRQDPDRQVPPPELQDCLGTDLARRSHQDHGACLSAVPVGCMTHSG